MRLDKKIIRQFVIFCIIGGINTLIDLGVFNLLSYLFGLDSTVKYFVWKSIGFVFAAVNSYFMNSYFTFAGQTKKTGKEFTNFVLVTVGTFIISTTITTILFNILSNTSDRSEILIGNICALVGVVINVVVNFAGYKLFVFK